MFGLEWHLGLPNLTHFAKPELNSQPCQGIIWCKAPRWGGGCTQDELSPDILSEHLLAYRRNTEVWGRERSVCVCVSRRVWLQESVTMKLSCSEYGGGGSVWVKEDGSDYSFSLNWKVTVGQWGVSDEEGPRCHLSEHTSSQGLLKLPGNTGQKSPILLLWDLNQKHTVVVVILSILIDTWSVILSCLLFHKIIIWGWGGGGGLWGAKLNNDISLF